MAGRFLEPPAVPGPSRSLPGARLTLPTRMEGSKAEELGSLENPGRSAGHLLLWDSDFHCGVELKSLGINQATQCRSLQNKWQPQSVPGSRTGVLVEGAACLVCRSCDSRRQTCSRGQCGPPVLGITRPEASGTSRSTRGLSLSRMLWDAMPAPKPAELVDLGLHHLPRGAAVETPHRTPQQS